MNITPRRIHPASLYEIPTWTQFVDCVQDYHNVAISERAVVVNKVILPVIGCVVVIDNVVGATHSALVTLELAYGEQAIISVDLTWMASTRTDFIETRFDVDVNHQEYDVYLAMDSTRTTFDNKVENVNDYNETFSAIIEAMPQHVEDLIDWHNARSFDI